MPRCVIILGLMTWGLAARPVPVFPQSPDPGVEDPFLWLEEVTGERALTWVKERNSESTAELAHSARFRGLNERILKILDSEERIPAVEKLGPYYYNFWRDARNPRGLWRRTTLEEYRRERPNWEIVIDLDSLGKEENVNWVWHGAQPLRPECKRALISLSRGGSDASVVREFDLVAKAFVKPGYTLPEAKSSLAWRGLDSVFVGTDFGPGSMTTSGYPRTVREWQRGTSLAQARLLFEGNTGDMLVLGNHDPTPGFERDFISRKPTFWTEDVFLRRDDKLVKLEKQDDADWLVHRQWLFLKLRSAWKVGSQTYPAGALLAADFEGFLKGERAFDVLFEPTERTSLALVIPTRHHVLLNVLDNVKTRLYVLSHRDGRWHREWLTGVPEFAMAFARAVDRIDSDGYFLEFTGYLTPTTLTLGNPGGAGPETLKSLPAFFKADGLSVSQQEVISRDGTRIPYFQICPKHLPLDGSSPTLLYGYGGFEAPMVPSYTPAMGAAWLEKGGVYVVANIRGGGEFGPRWHQAALKAYRHHAFDDFIAVAEDLVRRKVTSPEHLGARGESNGGLLVGNILFRRPDLFKAIVCQVPLLDMKRYSHLLAGASWMAEYGNPDVPAEWEFIKTFSPYHNIKKGVRYPRTLFMTSTRDDRVHPGHARKMVALMKSQGHEVLYYENVEGGHAGAADNKQSALMQALAYTFLWNELKR
jgi:prolyl oligopeptidase